MASALDTDLYQITMMAGYWRAGLRDPATFELFVRRLPPTRSYLIAAGLDQALDKLERVAFTREEREWLKTLSQFRGVPSAFFDEHLASFSFTGDVWAVPEGTPVFANEPLLRVTAPIDQAQLVETALLAIVGFQTSVAAKAARIVDAARGRPVVEFGARRAHGLGAALEAARAAYIGGCAATSYVEAARTFGIPASGTMAHSWVQAFPTELEAFKEFSRSFADSAVYLIDTYDTLRAAETLARSGLQPRAVRLDSGNLAALSRQVRAILDRAGLGQTQIFATGDLDEFKIAELLSSGAPVDAFGVGAAITTVPDAPTLSAVYKLVEIERGHESVGVVKLSPDKETWPGAKQVWRVQRDGQSLRDVIAAVDEAPVPDAVPLLTQVMAGGQRTAQRDLLADIRARCRDALERLPAAVRKLEDAASFDVSVSPTLETRRATLTYSMVDLQVRP